MRALLLAPVIDEASRYSYEWSRDVKKLLSDNGYEVVDLSGRPLSRVEVEEALRRNPGAVFIFYNHGNEDSLIASETENAVDTANVALLRNRECYTVACLSARKLGVEAYRVGCTAYWGFTDVFGFTTDALDEFRDFANIGIRLRVEQGLRWEQCLEEAKRLAGQLVGKLVSTGRIIAAILLQRDADALVCYTQDNPPESRCPLRRIAVRLLGPRIGWKVSRMHAVSLILFGGGLGTYVHDRIAEWVVLGCRLHGIDVGVALMILSWLVMSFEVVKWLKD